MKRLALLLTLAAFVTGSAFAGGKDWSTDAKASMAKAKKDGKLVLMDFTGSDWCGWCVELNKEVFSQKEFKDYAEKNLVLLELDYPNAKPQTDAVKKQNQELKEKHDISGFPTIIMADADGKVVWKQVGYLEGGPKAFIAAMEKAKSKGGVKNKL